MVQQTVNPFPSFNSDIQKGLDDIIDYIVNEPIPNPTVNDVNLALVNYIKDIFSYSTNSLNDVELNSYLPTAINAYINNDLKGITGNQAPFVNLLLEKIKGVPPLQILDFIAEVENNIAESELSLHEQNQLFMATAVASASYNYWLEQINNLSTSSWGPYLDTNTSVNIANLPFWVTATIQAALFFSSKGNYVTAQLEPPKISGPDYVTVLTASIGIAAGKVIFKWLPKISDKNFGFEIIEQGKMFNSRRRSVTCTGRYIPMGECLWDYEFCQSNFMDCINEQNSCLQNYEYRRCPTNFAIAYKPNK